MTDLGNAVPPDTGGESDHDLVERVKRGDMAAFDQIMLRHQEAVAGFVRGYVRSADLAEDLTQNVFIKAYMGLARYRPAKPLRHWLLAIAHSVGCDHWNKERTQRRHLPLHECGEWLAEREEDGAPVTDDTVAQAMQRLRPGERETLNLLYLEGLSVAEVAQAKGWNRDATKMRAYRARNKLRKLLERDGEGGAAP